MATEDIIIYGPELCQLCAFRENGKCSVLADFLDYIELEIFREMKKGSGAGILEELAHFVSDFADGYVQKEIKECKAFSLARNGGNSDRYQNCEEFDAFLSRQEPFDVDHILGLVALAVEEAKTPAIGNSKTVEFISAVNKEVTVKARGKNESVILQCFYDDDALLHVTSCVPALLEAAE